MQYSIFAGQILKINIMDLMGMMGKLKETQRKIEETKKTIRLCTY